MNWEKVLRLIHLTNFIMLEGQEALKLLLEENLSDFMMSMWENFGLRGGKLFNLCIKCIFSGNGVYLGISTEF